MSIEIIKASVQDAQIISNIHDSSWKVTYKGIIPQRYLDELPNDLWVPTFKNWISNKLFKVNLICENSVPVGSIAYGKSRDESLPNWGEIVSIYLHPDHVKKGYGQRLLDHALADMKSIGYGKCYLWVLKENVNARCFYEKNGFRRTEDEYNFEIMGEKLVDIRYVIDLNECS